MTRIARKLIITLEIIALLPIFYFINYLKIHHGESMKVAPNGKYLIPYIIVFVLDIILIVVRLANGPKSRKWIQTYLVDDKFSFNPLTGTLIMMVLVVVYIIGVRMTKLLIWGI
jgi:hypothetical protein